MIKTRELENSIIGKNYSIMWQGLIKRHGSKETEIFMFLCPCTQNTTTLFNIYGITEVSSWAACYQISGDDLWHSMSSSNSQPGTVSVTVVGPLAPAWVCVCIYFSLCSDSQARPVLIPIPAWYQQQLVVDQSNVYLVRLLNFSTPVTSSQSRLPLETTESQDGKEFSGQVPIGEPLLGTRLEVRSSDDARVGCGCGEIWIGEEERECVMSSLEPSHGENYSPVFLWQLQNKIWWGRPGFGYVMSIPLAITIATRQAIYLDSVPHSQEWHP